MNWPPRITLAQLPTPLTRLTHFSRSFADVDIWIKHDEMTGTEVSGNKVRKLEFSIAEALQQGCDTLITCGGVQSNHCRTTAILGARLGLHVQLILRGEKPATLEGNLLMDYLAGAEINYLPPQHWATAHTEFAKELQQRAVQHGNKAFFIPIGATDEIGLWGYIAASEELQKDFERLQMTPEYIVVATGSGGTQAGLSVGAELFSLNSQIVAFNVSDDATYFKNKILQDVTLWKQRYKQDIDLDKLQIKTIEGYVGPGYGSADKAVFDTIAQVAKSDGVFLDPVYTGKAFHGMVSELRKGANGALAGASNVVFVHTGGIFGVFPQQQNFQFD